MFELESPTPSEVDATYWPDDTAASLARERPGPDAVVTVSMLDPLTHSARIDLLVAVERQLAWRHAAARARVDCRPARCGG